VVGIQTATDLWARAGLINAGLVPDKDTKVVPMAFPVIGDAVRTGKVSAGLFVEPFYSAEMAKGGLRKLFTAVDAVGYEHELLDIFFSEKFLKAQPRRGARLPRRLRRGHQVLPRQHGAGQDRPAQGRLRAHAARRSTSRPPTGSATPNGRVNVESLEKLSQFMLEKLKWLEKPVNVREMVDQSYLPR
jgi:ABC-type nitrate/sulfonate/bicarbonate transport system substrate-binding protein